jgi:tetratricopeptide (TPR) repeat protein
MLIASGAAAQTESAGELWEKGQSAMRAGQPAKAIAYYERSLRADPGLTRNHLSLAAAYLERGADGDACIHLGRYVALHPEQLLIRSQYAELLLKLKRTVEARWELTRLLADQQERGDDGLNDVVECHSRLLDLAEKQTDEYAIHLHRGVGLYLLARQRAGLDDPEGVLPVEVLLCQSAGELTLARRLRPGEARPWLYLGLAWSRLGQAGPARRCLQEAAAVLPFSDLTASEQRSLTLAARACAWQRPDR